jgi:broad specificity phosphatase PhoE
VATRLTFLCAGATTTSRIGAFPSADEPLDEGGARKVTAFRLRGRQPDLVVASPSRSAVETACALELDARVEPLVADLDFGEWAGRSITDLQRHAPDRLTEWFADPTRAVPGGEAMDDLVARVGPWMDRQIGQTPAILVVSHAAVMRAVLSHALSVPLRSVMRIDIAPLTMLDLSHQGQWRLQELRRPR